MARLPLLNIRLDPADKERWSLAAEIEGKSLASLIKHATDIYVSNLLDTTAGQPIISANMFRIAEALALATAEHGRPNTFTPRELYDYYGAPTPMAIGRTLSRETAENWQAAFKRLEWEGEIPQYARIARRFYVSK